MAPEEISKKLSEFLISLRKKAGLSQEDIAHRSDAFGIRVVLDQRTISRIEKQPMKASAINIGAYMTAAGCDPSDYFTFLDKLTYRTEINAMNMVNATSRSSINDMIKSAYDNINNAKALVGKNPHPYLDDFCLDNKLNSAVNSLKSLDRKPVIGFFGHFDAGKSTLINTIIDEKLLPAKYQPATCIVNLLMHENDRPKSLKGQVALFKKGFMPHMIHDEGMVGQYLIDDGDISILDRLGVHNYDDSVTNEAYISIVFSSSEILERAWLLDTPGNLNDEDSDDSEIALSGVELVDGIVFLSKTTGFMSDIELYFGAQIIRQRPPVNSFEPLEHLLFVQSHCHSEIPDNEVESVGKIAFKRCKKQFEDLVFDSWRKSGNIELSPTETVLSNRVQPFWRENDLYRSGVIEKINQMVDYLATNHIGLVEEHIKRINKNIFNILDKVALDLEGKKKSVQDRIEYIQEQEDKFRKESNDLVLSFNEFISSCNERKERDLSALRNYYDAKVSVDSLSSLIRSSFESKKVAQNEIGGYLSQMLTSEIENTLKSSGNTFSTELDNLLMRWQKSIPSMQTNDRKVSDMGELSLEISDFNSRAAFIGGLSGLGSLGAMSLYVSTIASNLGAYILVGKAAGVLTSLGLAGSVTSVTSFVAAIGGPITIGIALATAIGYMVYRLAGGSWQDGLAKKVNEAFKKENVWEQVQQPVVEFWSSTEKATKAGLAELISETDSFIEALKADAKIEYDVKELDLCLVKIKKVSALF